MKKLKLSLPLIGLFCAAPLFQSCLDDDDNPHYYEPTALVTVCPNEDGSFVMNLDNETILRPTNISTSPFKNKKVRALVNFSEVEGVNAHRLEKNVIVHWIDSIRTKNPVFAVENNDMAYGKDPIEIVRDWVTVAEDGYLTLRVRTAWGHSGTPHSINLVSGVNPDDPFEMELRHNANGDNHGQLGDALIAFDISSLPGFDDNVRIILRWESFSGEKKTEFFFKPIYTDDNDDEASR